MPLSKTKVKSALTPVDSEPELVLQLSPESSILILLRALYSLMLPCGVYIREGFEPFFVTKEQLVTLVEHGKAESPVSDIPALEQAGLLRPFNILNTAGLFPDRDNALVINVNGARVCAIRDILNPPAPEPPVWWNAPLPFAMCSGNRLKINAAAARAFGSELERLRAVDLPQKNEFIVELEGRNRPCFLTFTRLPSRPGEAVVFILDDCTSDLAEAQDISWWAAVGRTWIASLESNGGTWRREENIPMDFKGDVLPCEWQGRFMGYLCTEPELQSIKSIKKEDKVEEPESAKPKRSRAKSSKKKTADDSPDESPKKKTRKRTRKSDPDTALENNENNSGTELETEPEQVPLNLKEDTLIQELSPQTMALLAAGQERNTSNIEDIEQDENSMGYTDSFVYEPELKPRSRRRRSKLTGGDDGLDQLI